VWFSAVFFEFTDVEQIKFATVANSDVKEGFVVQVTVLVVALTKGIVDAKHSLTFGFI
jgi:hypothetical protein